MRARFGRLLSIGEELLRPERKSEEGQASGACCQGCGEMERLLETREVSGCLIWGSWGEEWELRTILRTPPLTCHELGMLLPSRRKRRPASRCLGSQDQLDHAVSSDHGHTHFYEGFHRGIVEKPQAGPLSPGCRSSPRDEARVACADGP